MIHARWYYVHISFWIFRAFRIFISSELSQAMQADIFPSFGSHEFNALSLSCHRERRVEGHVHYHAGSDFGPLSSSQVPEYIVVARPPRVPH